MAINTSTALTQKQVNTTGLMNLGVVYVVWSSTYLAIRIAVREGAGFPPFMMGMMRMVASCLLLFALVRLRRQQIKLTFQELVTLAGSGLLLWTCANGLVTFAEQRADSGLVALLMAALPLWVTAIESLLDRKLPSKQVVASLLLGFIGIGLLMTPSFIKGVQADITAVLACILATICWSSGTLLQARRPVNLPPSTSSAYQMLAASVGFMAVTLVIGEPIPTPNIQAWLAFSYLVVLGTIAFLSYVTALRILPTNLVMTYAYVNPVLAVFLGWLILSEPITWWTVAGTVFVLLGITGVFSARRKKSQHG